MSNAKAVTEALQKLRNFGVGIALDDFGTGYSSLRYLSRMPLDTVKIDRSFVTGLTTSAEDASIAIAILSLADALNLEVVAEGVETEQQIDWLRAHGCAIAQGYRFSHPVAEQRFGEMWHTDQWRNSVVSNETLPDGTDRAVRSARRNA